MKKILILLALIAQMLVAAQISHKIDDEAYKTSSSVYLKPNQKLTMRFNVKDAKSINIFFISYPSS